MAKKKSSSKKKSQKKVLQEESKYNYSSIAKWLWALAVTATVFGFALLILVSFTRLPDTQELENPKYNYASQVHSADGVIIDRIFNENREWVTFEELSENVVNALIATEDIRYYSHSGIDARGLMRAVAHLGRNGGGSTVTQQLAKLFFTPGNASFAKRIWQKLKEWVIAIEFEKRYTKEEIIAMYLNKFDFLYNADGIGAAARTYFAKNQQDLNIIEAATLVGMLKNPFLYHPIKKPEQSEQRRNVVLKQMMRAGFITEDEYKTYYALPIKTVSNIEVHYDGIAPAFTARLKQEIKSILQQEQYSKPDGSPYNLYTDGLKIHTTIDSRMQEHAQKAKINSMQKLQKRYFEVWKNKDPWTYKADDKQRSTRLGRLKLEVERSQRYKNLRNKFLTPLKSKLSKDIDNVRLWDADLRRLVAASKDDNYLSKLVREDIISTNQRSVYKKILASDIWPELVDNWDKLNSRAKSDFSKKVKMKVFAYPEGEKSVVMTPLDSIRYHKQHMQIGSVSMDPRNGHIKTWVGGIGYKYFQYDHVKSTRQVGSTFKPLLYTASIFYQGHSPCLKIVDKQYTIPAKDPDFGLMESWSPGNSKDFTGEAFTLKECLRKSLNSASVYLVKSLGSVELVRDLAAKMGIDKTRIQSVPSISLGTPELSVLEMTGAYSTFANNGVHTKPVFIDRIVDNNGKTIYTADIEQSIAIPENFNYAMVDMLKYAAAPHSYKIKSDFGGKTGTTNDYVDGWFMGITPNLVVGTWVGGSDPWIRFLSISDGAGGQMARPYYFDFMKRIESDKAIGLNTNATFQRPEGDLGIELDCSRYAYPTEAEEIPKKDDDLDDFEDPEEETIKLDSIGN